MATCFVTDSYLHRPLGDDECVVLDHGVDVKAVYRHQVHVTKLV